MKLNTLTYFRPLRVVYMTDRHETITPVAFWTKHQAEKYRRTYEKTFDFKTTCNVVKELTWYKPYRLYRVQTPIDNQAGPQVFATVVRFIKKHDLNRRVTPSACEELQDLLVTKFANNTDYPGLDEEAYQWYTSHLKSRKDTMMGLLKMTSVDQSTVDMVVSIVSNAAPATLFDFPKLQMHIFTKDVDGIDTLLAVKPLTYQDWLDIVNQTYYKEG